MRDTTSNHRYDNPSSIYSPTELIHYSRVSCSSLQKALPGTQYITDEFLDNILNSVLTSEERREFESKSFLSLYELISPNNRNNRNAKRHKNSFLIFRKDYQARKVAELGPYGGSRVKEISNGAGSAWKKFSPEDKYMYIQLSLCAKKLHNKLWPNCSSTKKYANYGYGEIGEQYLTTFLKTPTSRSPSDHGPNSNQIPNELTSSNRGSASITSNRFIERCRSGIQLNINTLSSYDKSLVNSINKNVRI
ncbi:9113_t:CDS:2 [Acaulospora morrowiae]|uniref:9113_t:CDS:1 n=1 Tax=Acaulospora morrowiae TaxID=94023 RepID=A0A9N9F304_9GLOM|nr:9113_t:CDS:2 [Acaulospora morrowiae]